MSSPKEHFLTTRKEAADSLFKVVREGWYEDAMHYAFSQFCREGHTAEEIKGAADFMELVHSFADAPKSNSRPTPTYGVERPKDIPAPETTK